MKVILREDIKNKGEAGSIIEVKTGYARNYLIPQGLAYLASDANTVVFNREKLQKEKKMVEKRTEAEKRKKELEEISLTAVVKVGDDGKLFGSVNSQTISDLLKEKRFEFSHRKITIDDQIKELGVFETTINIFQDISATVKVWVVKE